MFVANDADDGDLVVGQRFEFTDPLVEGGAVFGDPRFGDVVVDFKQRFGRDLAAALARYQAPADQAGK